MTLEQSIEAHEFVGRANVGPVSGVDFAARPASADPVLVQRQYLELLAGRQLPEQRGPVQRNVAEGEPCAIQRELPGAKGEIAIGYQVRNYVLQPYTLVKDVRTGMETSQVQNVLDGDIDEFIQAYLRRKAEREHKKPPENGKVKSD